MPQQAYRVSESTFRAIGSASRAGNVTMNETVDWREGMRDLGRQLRHVRELLRRAPDQVDRLAGELHPILGHTGYHNDEGHLRFEETTAALQQPDDAVFAPLV